MKTNQLFKCLAIFAFAFIVGCSKDDLSNETPKKPVPEQKEEEEEEEELTEFVAEDPEAMTKAETEQMADYLFKKWAIDFREKANTNLKNKTVVVGNETMKFAWKTFGNEPADGRSLWISLHGGGGTTEGINNQQWGNQQNLYKLEEGFYICPRAPWDVWYMWFNDPLEGLFEELIRTFVSKYGVNQNKIFIMGYSAGGDGVWRLAPRMADHWASAAMMAGHPGEVQLLNVRNMPFTIWVGGNDTDYNRNVEVAKKGLELDSLQRNDPEGYIHENNILAGYPHWMDSRDTAAVTWMKKFVRNPHPNKIVWRQEGVLHKAFYWIEAPENELAPGKIVRAEIKENTVYIKYSDYTQLTIYLADDMVDLDKEVIIYNPNADNKTYTFKRSKSTLLETLQSRYDKGYMFPVKVVIDGIAPGETVYTF